MTLSPTPAAVFGMPVVQDHIGSAGKLLSPVNIVLHTTEGAEAGDPRPTFRARGDAPHFCTSLKDGGTIWQLRPLDQWAAALRHGTVPAGGDSPNAHAVQIEICGFSQTRPWALSPQMLELVAACVAYMSQFHGCPLVVPNPAWKDDCSDMPMPWAAHNSRRQWADTHWPASRGVWEHVEVPWQDPTWHYDCGALDRTQVITAAKALLGPPPGGPVLTDDDAKQLGYATVHDWEVQEQRAKAVSDVLAGRPKRQNPDPDYAAQYDATKATLAAGAGGAVGAHTHVLEGFPPGTGGIR